MNLRLLPTFLLATLAMGSAAATAQTIYKCGNSYSQSPCPGGQSIDASDSRSPAQKAQTDAATLWEARTANALEQARLQQEKKARVASTVSKESAVPPAKGKAKKKEEKEKKPGYFTAREPGSSKPTRKNKQSTPGSANPAGKP